MKKLIIVRHGQYDGDMNLTEYGQDQMRTLAGQIAEQSGGGSIKILSSSAPRAAQSAQVLSDELNAPMEQHEILWSENSRPTQLDKVLDLIKKHVASNDVLVLVTHLEYTDSLLYYYDKQVLGYEDDSLLVHLRKGEMTMVDCNATCPVEQTMEVEEESTQEPAIDDFLVTDTTISKQVAKRYIEVLRMVADAEKMLSVHMFGSIAVHGYGRDIDLVIEVPDETFVEFAGNCIGALDGFHPIEKALLPMASMYWNYYSPVLARLHYILEGIGVSAEQINELAEIIPEDKVDMLCLPVAWNTPGHVYEMIEENFGNLGGDPKLLKNISDSCIQVI